VELCSNPELSAYGDLVNRLSCLWHPGKGQVGGIESRLVGGLPGGMDWSLLQLLPQPVCHPRLFLHPQAALRGPASGPKDPGGGVTGTATAAAGEGGAAVPGPWSRCHLHLPPGLCHPHRSLLPRHIMGRTWAHHDTCAHSPLQRLSGGDNKSVSVLFPGGNRVGVRGEAWVQECPGSP
jgi:hypothetical protein